MTRKYAEIFCWKNVSSFCSANATHIFSAKNIRILYIESVKTVNEMTLNELFKQMMLWTTGPSFVTHSGGVSCSGCNAFIISCDCLWFYDLGIQYRCLRLRIQNSKKKERKKKKKKKKKNQILYLSLTLKSPITTAADNILKYFYYGKCPKILDTLFHTFLA